MCGSGSRSVVDGASVGGGGTVDDRDDDGGGGAGMI